MKVWILEAFYTREQMEADLIKFKEMRDETKKDETLKHLWDTADMIVENHEKRMAEKPNGYWYGSEGKIKYKEFCEVARAAIERNKGKGLKFRVVKADIADDAETWVGYKNPVENEGVLKYLLATT